MTAIIPAKPAHPHPDAAKAIVNPRAARLANFEALLEELSKQPLPPSKDAQQLFGPPTRAKMDPTVASTRLRLALQDVSNLTSAALGAGAATSGQASSARAPPAVQMTSLEKANLLLAVPKPPPPKAAPLTARDVATTKPTQPATAAAVLPSAPPLAARHRTLSTGANRQPVSGSGASVFEAPTRSASTVVQPSSTSSSSATASPTVPAAAPGGSVAITNAAALVKHRNSLTAYEQKEIMSFDDIWYVGEGARKNMNPGTTSPNFGFDDDKGDYKVINDDHIAYRYQILNSLGRGSFGQVSRALDHKTGHHVAVKIIKNKKKFHDQALVEVRILKHLRDKDPQERNHVIRLVDSFVFREHMIIVFELHGMNLYELCKSNRFAPLPLGTIRDFTRQLVKSLQYTTQERIVHCDMKPENILLKKGSKTQLRVIDFGSSCFENERMYTYIQSRFYRAPEVMFGIPYTPAIDMWSLGCIVAELANGYPIFPGENEVEQMQCIMEVVGAPPKALVDRAPRRKVFVDSNGVPRVGPNSRGKVRRPASKDLATFLRTVDTSFVDFVRALLTWEPEKRLTPTAALRHPWLAEGSAPESPRVESSSSTAVGAAAIAGPAVHLPLLPLRKK